MLGLFGFGKKKEQQQEMQQQKIDSEARYIVIYDRKTCIGAGVCAAVDGKHWEMAQDGKALLKNSEKKSDVLWEREISESELAEVKKAAFGCPPSAIHIIKKDTGEKIV